MNKSANTRERWEEIAMQSLGRTLRASEKLGPFPRGTARLKRKAEVSVVTAAVMRKLNREFRGKDRPTDVLSFPAPPTFMKQGMLGELIICLPVMISQAKEHGHEPETELMVLVVHGVLHLLGMDHEPGPKHAKAMAAAEAKLLTTLLRRRSAKSSAASTIRSLIGRGNA